MLARTTIGSRVFAPIVGVSERPAPESLIPRREERLNPPVFPRTRILQSGKIVVQNLVQRRGEAFTALEQSHPPSVPQQNVIQQSMNAAERSHAFLSVLGILQLRTFRK
jgi:hypothetical protein